MFRRNGAAMGSPQVALGRQPIKVAPDGIVRRVKELGQFGHVDVSVRPNELQDVVTPLKGKSRRRTRSLQWHVLLRMGLVPI